MDRLFIYTKKWSHDGQKFKKLSNVLRSALHLNITSFVFDLCCWIFIFQISQRVRVHELQRTLVKFSNISTSLERFLQVLKSTGRYALQQANVAYDKLEQYLVIDLKQQRDNIIRIKEKYDRFRGSNITLAVAMFEQTQMELREKLLYNGTKLIETESLQVIITFVSL